MPSHRAPTELTSFVGRRDELDAVGAAVRPGRVLTLVGAGGAGKTRLALRTASERAADWQEGAWWVDLSAASDDAGAAGAVSAALDIVLGPTDAIGSLAQVLADRRLLLVLDNCEQVTPSVAALVDAVAAAAPLVGMLATSRAPLGAGAERVWRVPPMSLTEALALFLDRAEAAGSVVNDGGGARRICERLDRLPLALELAAGWTSTLAIAEIAESVSEPLSLLEGGPRTAPYRLQTLHGSVRWSHDLLDEDEQRVFRRLAAFRPGFTADQAVGVCSGTGLSRALVLRALRHLVDSSLVVADTAGDTVRYRMLEVIHAFGRERLAESGERDAVLDRHVGVFGALVADLRLLLEDDKDTWRARIRSHYANVVAAIEWGLTRADPRPARELAAGMAWLWHLESHGHEGLRLLAAAAAGDERSGLQARLLVALALVSDTTVPGGEGYRHANSGLAMAEEVGDADTARLASALLAIGAMAHDLDAARARAQRARSDGLAAGDVFVAEGCAVLLGILHYLHDEHADALALLEPAARTLLARGDRGVASTAFSHVALAMARTGRLAEASVWAEEGATAARPLHDLHRLGLATAVQAEVLALRGRTDEATGVLGPIEGLLTRTEQSAFVPGWERTMARLALWQGRPADAVRWCRREVRWLGETATDERLTAETQVVLATALRLAGEEPRARSTLDGVDQVAERLGLHRLRAAVAEERGHLAATTDVEAALEAHHEALALRAERDLVPGCADSLEAIAALELRRGTTELSVTLAAAAEEIRATTGYAARSAPPEPALCSTVSDPAYAGAVDRGRALALEAVPYARRMRGPRARPGRGWASLTPTELTVVELASRGLTNPQIAREMFVAPGTVKTHLAHVYAKLGVANRTDLARLAAHHDP